MKNRILQPQALKSNKKYSYVILHTPGGIPIHTSTCIWVEKHIMTHYHIINLSQDQFKLQNLLNFNYQERSI